MNQIKYLSSSKSRYLLCKVIPEMLGRIAGMFGIILFTLYLHRDKTLSGFEVKNIVWMPLLYIPVLIHEFLTKFFLETDLPSEIKLKNEDLILHSPEKLAYGEEEIDLAEVDFIRIHQERVSYLIFVRFPLPRKRKYDVRLVQIRKIKENSSTRSGINLYKLPTPQDDFFFLARYTIADGIKIFLLNLVSFGLIKDLFKKIFLKQTFTPLKKRIDRKYIEKIRSDRFSTNIYSE